MLLACGFCSPASCVQCSISMPISGQSIASFSTLLRWKQITRQSGVSTLPYSHLVSGYAVSGTSVPLDVTAPLAGIVLKLALHGIKSVTDGDINIFMRTVLVMMLM